MDGPVASGSSLGSRQGGVRRDSSSSGSSRVRERGRVSGDDGNGRRRGPYSAEPARRQQSDASSDDARQTHAPPVKSQLSRINGGLRKTRSKLSLASSPNKSSSPSQPTATQTTPNKIGNFFNLIMNSNSPRSPSAKKASFGMYERAVNYLFDPEALNDDPANALWIMGRQYHNQTTETSEWPPQFSRDFASTIACTYRTQFDPIPCAPSNAGVAGMLSSLSLTMGMNKHPRDGLSTDTGWGCMLRTGQSLLANALSHLHLGRDWRLPPASSSSTSDFDPVYARLVSLFLDSPSPMCPFSIHRFALMGKQLGKDVGEWFGPSTAAGAIQALVNEYEPAAMRVVNFVDGSMYESKVREASRDWTVPVLVVMGLRLGINGVNPIYHKAVLSLFELPQCVGIAGGRPSSSFYFIGSQGDSLFYIDPHHTKPALSVPPASSDIVALSQSLPLSSPTSATASASSADPQEDARAKLDEYYRSAYGPASFESYHVSRIRKTSIDSLDPSMLLGFLIRSQSDWSDFVRQTTEKGIVVNSAAAPSAAAALGEKRAGIFVIQEKEPAWMTSVGPASPSSARPKAGARGSQSRSANANAKANERREPSTDFEDFFCGDSDDSGQEEEEEEDEDDFEDLAEDEMIATSPVLVPSSAASPVDSAHDLARRTAAASERAEGTTTTTDSWDTATASEAHTDSEAADSHVQPRSDEPIEEPPVVISSNADRLDSPGASNANSNSNSNDPESDLVIVPRSSPPQ